MVLGKIVNIQKVDSPEISTKPLGHFIFSLTLWVLNISPCILKSYFWIKNNCWFLCFLVQPFPIDTGRKNDFHIRITCLNIARMQLNYLFMEVLRLLKCLCLLSRCGSNHYKCCYELGLTLSDLIVNLRTGKDPLRRHFLFYLRNAKYLWGNSK